MSMNDSDLDELIMDIKDGDRPTIFWGVVTVLLIVTVVL